MRTAWKPLLCLVAIVTSACGAPTTSEDTLVTASADQALVNAQLDTGQFPQVGTLVRPFPGKTGLWSSCSGTLIGKKVFLTAGHCVAKLFSMGLQHGEFGVSFDGVFVPGVSSVTFGTAYLHPQFDATWLSNDVGIVVLDSAVAGLKTKKLARPYVLEKMEADELAEATIVTVGYGATVFDQSPALRGTRRVATQHFLGLCGVECNGSPDNFWVVLGGPYEDGNGATRPGDSGGPHFLDGRIIAVSSLTDGGASGMAFEKAQRVDVKPVRQFIMSFLEDDDDDD